MFAEAAADANGLTDIRIIDTTTANQTPVDVVATTAGVPAGFAKAGTMVLYGDAPGATGVKLHGVPIAGGTAVDIANDVVSVAAPEAGNGLVFRTNSQTVSGVTVADAKYLDVTKPTVVAPLATAVPKGGYTMYKNTWVYTSLDATAGGLYAVDLP
jgi:hypothetical protein